MDGLSGAASIIAVVQIAGSVIIYLKDVKDAPKECRKCMVEISNSNTLLLELDLHLSESGSQEAWYVDVRALAVKDGPLDQYKLALQHLLAKVESKSKVRKLANALTWNFIKEDVASILARMERLKSLVSIALEMDHFKLSRAIKEDTSSIRDTLPSLQTDIIIIRDKQNLQWDAQKLQQHNAIMQWLSPTDFPTQQYDIISRRQEGTGQWFLDAPKFKRWLQGSDKTLFCPGIPGAGKTMTAAITIDSLCTAMRGDNIGVAYLFCSYKAQTDQSVLSLFAALLKQLVQNRPDIAAPVTQIYELHSKRGSKPSFSDILQTLQSILSAYTTIFIVVDALDECSDTEGARSQLIQKLHELQMGKDVRLLFTSRLIPEITQKFDSKSTLEVRASEEDVRRFVDGQILRLPRCIQRDEELKSAVQNKIVEAVDGMFLLARLHVDSLLDKRNKQKVLSTLNKLSKGSAALSDAYNDAIQRIDGQLPEDRSLARRTLSWISYAQRLLTTKELCHALAIEPGNTTLNTDNIDNIEDIISVCAGLVTEDKESSVVRLVHYTTQEYFELVRLKWYPGAQEEIGIACLTYLSFDIFRCGSCGRNADYYAAEKVASDRALEQRFIDNPFFDYAAHFWSEHIRPVQDITSQLALAFLGNEMLVDSTTQGALAAAYQYRGRSRSFPDRTTGLHFTARYGLVYLTQRLLIDKYEKQNVEADSKDSFGRTPLLYAAWNGQEAVVQLLSERDDVEVDSKDNDGRTPLLYAAWGGHEAVVQLLAERDDVEVDSKDNYDRTPLSWAAGYGHEAVVQLLAEWDNVEIDSRDDDGQTPLSYATSGGHKAVVQLLLDTGNVEADLKDYNGRTPLLYAAWGGHKAVVQLLAKRDDVEVDSKDNDGRTPLSWAAGDGEEAVVQLLAKRDDVEVDSKDNDGRTPLSWAAGDGEEAVVQLLAKRDDVEVDSKDNDGRTPLSWAAGDGHEAVVQLLAKRDDVEVDSKDNDGRTPLSWAAGDGEEAVVQLLAKRDDVEVDSKDNDGRTPLSWAAGDGEEAVVQLLAKRDDVEVDSKDNDGRTPLSWAAGDGHEAVVQLLAKRDDVEVDSKDNDGRTPLSWAAGDGEEAVVQLLAKRDDVEVDSKDNDSRTPLSWAAGYGHEAVVQLLAKRDDVEVDSKDNDGRTPLSWAAGDGEEAVVQLLAKRDDVEVDSKDNDGRTPLSYAAWLGHEAVVQLLLDTGNIEADSKNKYGRTPLSYAAWGGHEAVVQLLLDTGNVEAGSKDYNGRTPLLYAAWGGHEAVVQLLAERDDVEVDSKDNDGRTPLSWAEERGHKTVVKLLQRSIATSHATNGHS